MRAWVGRNRAELVVFPLLLLAVTLFVVGCPRPTPEDDVGVPVAGVNCANSTAASFNYSTSQLMPSILCPALPESPSLGNISAGPGQAIYYQDWAWKSFVSLNWPAVVPSSTNGNARGFANYSSAFGQGAPDTIPVWGTWKEKRELFSLNASTPGPWNSEYDYFLSYPPCSSEDADAIQSLGGHGRLFAQSSKTPLANSLDEAIEVPTESGPQPAVITNPNDWVAAAVVEPRVWRTSRADDNTIVYEVKLGWDYYDYVASNELYNDSVVGNSTLAGTRAYNSGDFTNFPNNQDTQAVNFPRRTGKYNVSYCEQYNRNSSQPTPCPTGTIQTKSGWVRLNQSEIDSGRFHWTRAQYYRMNTSFPPDNLCTAVGDFGLLGFHIIQKTANQGHYVYATWEQAGNDASNGFVFSNYFPGNQTHQAGFYPPDNGSPNAVPVSRDHSYTTGAWNTSTINDIYHNLMPASSVWRNYNLIGVQFLPVNSDSSGEPFEAGSDDPTNIGQPFYLANLVIETNWGLQNFQGTPPGSQNGMVPPAFTPTQGFMNASQGQAFLTNPTIAFNRSNPNLGHNRRNGGQSYGGVFNMGGCMGCHGVAQANGFDFSFVLQRGQNGSMVEPINGPPP